MKKIFTLLVAVGMVTFASAQSGKKNNSFPGQQQTFEKGKLSGYETYSFSMKEKDMQIHKINREYDQKIAAVRKNWRMRAQEKSKLIRKLENQRNVEIKQVLSRWEKSRDHDNWGQNKGRSHY